MARTLFQRQRTSEVLSTSSMAEAVLHLMASPVSACLVGVAENEPGGVEFLRWLRDRKASPCPDVPVTALTDSKNPAFIQKICRFGIEGLLRKPVSQEGLTRRVSQMIIEPKRMVIAPGYLGPDRRIIDNSEAFGGPERRRPSEPILAEDRPRPAVVMAPAAKRPEPPKAPTTPIAQAPKQASNPVAPVPLSPIPAPDRPKAPQAPPLTVAAKPAAAPAAPVSAAPKPATPAVAAAIAALPPLPPVPQFKQAAAPEAKPAPAKTSAPAPVAKPAAAIAVHKPVGAGTKLELGEAPPLAAKTAGTKLDMGAPPVQAAKPAMVAAAPVPPPAAPAPPPRPKVKPVKLAFDLNGVLDAHRTWVLSRGTEGGRAALSRQVMVGVDLSGAILTQADLTYCRMTGAECSEARLDGADLRYAEMAGADLTEAVLGAARLRHVNLEGAKLKGANLRGADLSGADLRGADLEGAQMHGAIMLDTMINDTDLSSAEGLTQAQINKTRRNMQTKLPPGVRLNLGEDEPAMAAAAT
ncbi:MAG: pentapeptide repeat-containing protein [Alphaproteobacteria bacterium]|nr:pentapeptide repeat-containing protein [Alphaproteobacteria bacterium]